MALETPKSWVGLSRSRHIDEALALGALAVGSSTESRMSDYMPQWYTFESNAKR